MSQAEWLGEFEAKEPRDRGYDYEGSAKVHLATQERCYGASGYYAMVKASISNRIGYGLYENNVRLGRNCLGAEGNKIKAILCGAGRNIQKLRLSVYFHIAGHLKIVLRSINYHSVN